MLRRASPSAFLPKIEASSASSRESPDTSCSRKAVGSFHTGGPFLYRTGAQWLDHVLLRAVPFLLSDVQEVCHPHLHLHASRVHEPVYMSLWVTKSITRFSRTMPAKHAYLQFFFLEVFFYRFGKRLPQPLFFLLGPIFEFGNNDLTGFVPWGAIFWVR